MKKIFILLFVTLLAFAYSGSYGSVVTEKPTLNEKMILVDNTQPSVDVVTLENPGNTKLVQDEPMPQPPAKGSGWQSWVSWVVALLGWAWALYQKFFTKRKVD